jgi:hypothetical protein
MKKWLKRIGIGILVIVLLLSVVTYLRFSQWRSEVTKNLARDSTGKGADRIRADRSGAASSHDPRGSGWL